MNSYEVGQQTAMEKTAKKRSRAADEARAVGKDLAAGAPTGAVFGGLWGIPGGRKGMARGAARGAAAAGATMAAMGAAARAAGRHARKTKTADDLSGIESGMEKDALFGFGKKKKKKKKKKTRSDAQVNAEAWEAFQETFNESMNKSYAGMPYGEVRKDLLRSGMKKVSAVRINADSARMAVEAVKLMSPAMISGAMTGAFISAIRNRGQPDEAIKGALLGGVVGGIVGTGGAMGGAKNQQQFQELQHTIGALSGGISAFIPNRKRKNDA